MIKKDEVKHIADLARIGSDEKELEEMSKDLSSILDWVEQLKKAEVAGVEPMEFASGSKNKVREDIAREFENKEKIIKLFPEEKNGYNKVKSVL